MGSTLPLHYVLMLSGIVFAIGVIGVIIRRNLIIIMMSIELMLNAVNIAFVAFARFHGAMTPVFLPGESP